MNVQQFLEQHSIARNPFAEEDAQTDPVFKERCLASAYHPSWDKIFGDPAEPSTAVVFGEKGSGKTALRLQIAGHLDEYNRQHGNGQLFVVHYDDFNSFLDRFRARLPSRRQRPERVLAAWQLWDHMDAILTLATTQLVDMLVPGRTGDPPKQVATRIDRLDPYQRRDVLLLAACYDQSTAAPALRRWHQVRRTLRYRTWRSWLPLLLGVLVTLLVLAGWGTQLFRTLMGEPIEGWPTWHVFLVLLVLGWALWGIKALRRLWLAWGLRDHIRVGNHSVANLWKMLMNVTGAELAAQPLPTQDRTDDRYEQLGKLQGILQTLGHRGIIVLVDRIDEPHLITGSAELMRGLVWPLLDNKFLKHSGLGIKLMLPVELMRFIQREEHDFYQRARLDKQNMVPSLEWTGEALYDMANARIRACAVDGTQPQLRDWFEAQVTDQRLIDGFRRLRVPRHLFKFLYRLVANHCNAHSEREPVWKISESTFDSTLALYLRDLDAADRGLGVG